MVLRDTRNQTLGLSWCAGLRLLNIPEYTAAAKWNLEAGSYSVRRVLNSASQPSTQQLDGPRKRISSILVHKGDSHLFVYPSYNHPTSMYILLLLRRAMTKQVVTQVLSPGAWAESQFYQQCAPNKKRNSDASLQQSNESRGSIHRAEEGTW